MTIDLQTKSGFILFYLFLDKNPIHKFNPEKPKYSFEIGFGYAKHGLLWGFDFNL